MTGTMAPGPTAELTGQLCTARSRIWLTSSLKGDAHEHGEGFMAGHGLAELRS